MVQNTMNKQRFSLENWKINDTHWKSTKSHRKQKKHICIQWKTMKANETHWYSMKINVNLCKTKKHWEHNGNQQVQLQTNYMTNKLTKWYKTQWKTKMFNKHLQTQPMKHTEVQRKTIKQRKSMKCNETHW